MEKCSNRLAFGPGKIDGSIYLLFRVSGIKINPVYLSTVGKLYFGLSWLLGKPIFGDTGMRAELIRRFGVVSNSKLAGVDLDGYPSLSLAAIEADPEGVEKIRSAFDWLAGAVKGGTSVSVVGPGPSTPSPASHSADDT